jgi:anaerobic magnesium-protoporphyrin IX monomethyl ester cyclase
MSLVVGAPPPRPPRILLVHPSSRGRAALAATRATSEHMGLAYLSAALATASSVPTILDFENTPMNPRRFADYVSDGGFDVVGFSPTSKSSSDAIESLKLAKRSAPNVVAIWGGHLATGLRHDAFNLVPELDVVVLGDGIGPIVLIDAAMRSGRTLPRHPQVLINPRSGIPVVDVQLNKPPPLWHDLVPARYLPESSYRERGARVVTSLGCPYDCTFCTTPFFSGRKVARRSVEHTIEEIDQLVNLGAERIWINDDLFIDGSTRSKKWAREFCVNLHRRHPLVRFRALCRSDTFQSDPELLAFLARNGMDAIFIGLESGDDDTLSELSKRTTVSDGLWIAREIERLGLVLQPGFIMFTPQTTLQRLRNNIEFLFKIQELYRMFPVTRTAVAFPGTQLWNQMHAKDDVDAERSTPCIAYPRFQSSEVRYLSIAFEYLEEQLASMDSELYDLRVRGVMHQSTRLTLSKVFRTKLLETIDLAEAAPGPERIITSFDGFEKVVRTIVASTVNRIH